jgi:hypothetical protein
MNELINHYDYIIIINAVYTWLSFGLADRMVAIWMGTNTGCLSFGMADRMVARGQLSGCNG